MFLLSCAVTGLNSQPEAFFVFLGCFASTALPTLGRKPTFERSVWVSSKRVFDFCQTASTEGSSAKRMDLLGPLDETVSLSSLWGQI